MSAFLLQWATTGPKVRPDQRTVEEMEAEGWEQCGVDPRYVTSRLMRKVEE